jgi:hypothetical protein
VAGGGADPAPSGGQLDASAEHSGPEGELSDGDFEEEEMTVRPLKPMTVKLTTEKAEEEFLHRRRPPPTQNLPRCASLSPTHLPIRLNLYSKDHYALQVPPLRNACLK